MILTLDLSTKSTGYAIFDGKQLHDYGVLKASGSDLIKRIYIISDKIKNLLQENEIDKIYIEEVQLEKGKQSKTYTALMYMQAALMFLLYKNFDNKIPVEKVYSSTWRKDCGIKIGPGVERETLKRASIDKANSTFNLSLERKDDDIADAICIGIAQTNPQQPLVLNWG